MIAQLLAISLAAVVPTPTPTATTPTSTPTFAATTPGLSALALPAALLVGLAAAALVLGRRRRTLPRRLHVLETASLGPKRAIVLAQIGGEVLVLGSSEAGITLLDKRPATELGAAGASPLDSGALRAPTRGTNGQERPAHGTGHGAASATGRQPPAPAAARLAAKLGLARGPAPAAPAFEALLVESAEDPELRRKLAAGRPGSVR